jgi:hypothetical protein
LNGIKGRVTNKGIAYPCGVALLLELVGNGDIDLRAITGHAPLDTTMSSAFTNAGLPENFALFIWIERVNNA